MVLFIELVPPFKNDLKVKGVVGAGNEAPYRFTFETSAGDIAALHNDLLAKDRAATVSKEDRHHFVRVLLGVGADGCIQGG